MQWLRNRRRQQESKVKLCGFGAHVDINDLLNDPQVRCTESDEEPSHSSSTAKPGAGSKDMSDKLRGTDWHAVYLHHNDLTYHHP